MNLLSILRNTLTADGPRSSAAHCNETCPACGQSFHCGASLRGCWCTEVRVTDAQRATLRESYPQSRCLCRPCLERAANNL